MAKRISLASPSDNPRRHVDGFVPSFLQLRIAQRNPEYARRLFKTMIITNNLYRGSFARLSELHRFVDKAVDASIAARFVYDAQNKGDRPGKLVRKDGDPKTGDETADNAFDFHGIISDFHRIWHKRNSIDGNGMALKGIVHYLVNYLNAFWDGHYMTYGDGDKILFLTFVLLFIAAHEMEHGITEHAVPGGIEYYGQPGAINEHLSDVGGAKVESWFLKLSALKYHFLVGKGIFVPPKPGSGDVLLALRDMRNPGHGFHSSQIGDDPQPWHMKDYVKGEEDNGGVHTNSGIPNGAFVFVCDGIEKANIGGDWATTIGIAANIWYAARPNLGNTPSFANLAYWTIECCDVVPGLAPQVRKIVQESWDHCGVKPSKTEKDLLTPPRNPDRGEIKLLIG
jgi:Zn-dependent metalloprotease